MVYKSLTIASPQKLRVMVMSVLPETSGSSEEARAARVLGRFERQGFRGKGAPEPVAPAESPGAVTLGGVGDFLELDLRRLFFWLRTGLRLAFVLALVGGTIGCAYAFLAKPRYTVSTDILIDPANLQVVPQDSLYAQPEQGDTQLRAVGSKLRVLTSGNVLARAVDQLDLVQDKDFYNPNPGFGLSSLLSFGGKPAGPALDPKVVALDSLERDVTTRTDDNSYVAELDVSASSPQKAIEISDAIVKAFQDELAREQADGAGRAAAALNDRLNGLKAAAEEADQKVEAYKRSHNLLATGGQLVNAQSMSQLNSQVVAAQSQVISAQSGYDAVIAAGRNADPSDAVASASLTALRDQADSLRQQLDSDSQVYGPRHPTILRAKAEYAAVTAQIDAEVARIVAAAKSTLDQAKASLAALEAKQNALKSGIFSDNEAQVGLDQLQRDADAKTAVYQSFLSRAQQITQGAQIDTTNVRVISTARPPPDRSWPPRTVVLIGLGVAGGFFFGLLLAIVFGAVRDLRAPLRRNSVPAG
jgi:uncharacterized protein involved in exopolysaccharide biosynthesis